MLILSRTTEVGRQTTDEENQLASFRTTENGRQTTDQEFSVVRPPSSVLRHPSFADLVVIARSLYPIPSRTRPSKSSAPMVLSLKAWKSRSLPGLPRTERSLITISRLRANVQRANKAPRLCPRGFAYTAASGPTAIVIVRGKRTIQSRPDIFKLLSEFLKLLRW